MIESTSSWTKASGWKPNVFAAQGTTLRSSVAPGMSACASSQRSSRSAIPAAFAMPPSPASDFIVRWLSVMANCPRRKNAERGSVAIQFGLPRPAFRYAICEALAVFAATFARSFLISKGLSVSYCCSVTPSMTFSSRCGARPTPSTDLPAHEQHDGHAEDGEQRVADGVGHAVAQRRNLALAGFLNHPQRGGRCSYAGADAEENGRMELEDVVSEQHRDNERHRRRDHSPDEQAEADLLQPGEEPRPGVDAD